VEYVEERWARRLVAVNLEGVRLIENVPVAEPKQDAEKGDLAADERG
jgi:hypothetical protein